MYYEFTDIFEKQDINILKEVPIIFEELPYTFKNHCGNQYNFKLFLIEKKWGVKSQYSVLAHTKYISDNDFTSNLEAYDRIHYPISMLLNEKFDTLENAEKFFNDIINILPKPLDLTSKLKEVKVYGFDSRKSVNYDFFNGRRYPDDIYNKDLLHYNYTKFFIRMFRFKSEILINKSLVLEFNNEDKAIEVFNEIKKYFEAFETIKLSLKQSNLHVLLEKLIEFALSENVNNLELRKDRDDFKRFTMLSLKFKHNDCYFNVGYNLPTRNGDYGYTIDSSIYIYDKNINFYKSYDHEEAFIDGLNKVFNILNI